MDETGASYEPAMVPHCLMCGALIQRGEGVVKWQEGFPFTFCSRDCQADYGFVNARIEGLGIRLDRDDHRSLYRSQGWVAQAVR
ncbi:MAG: hypothetical protein AABX47_08930 [Nanoarchaeota archaeon]